MEDETEGYRCPWCGRHFPVPDEWWSRPYMGEEECPSCGRRFELHRCTRPLYEVPAPAELRGCAFRCPNWESVDYCDGYCAFAELEEPDEPMEGCPLGHALAKEGGAA